MSNPAYSKATPSPFSASYHRFNDKIRSFVTAGIIAAAALTGCAAPKQQLPSRSIIETEAFGAKDFNRYGAQGKILVGDKSGAYVQGQHAEQKQTFENGTLEGTINRVGGGLYHYVDLYLQKQLYVDAAVISENRKFTFNPELGNNFRFGNDVTHAVGKIGYVHNGTFDNKSSVVDPSKTKVLFTIASGTGDMTGDSEGTYESFRWTLEGRQRIGEESAGWFVTGGIANNREHLGDRLTNTVRSVAFGFGNDGHNFLGIPAEWAITGTRRSLEARMNDIEESVLLPGFTVSGGLKLSDSAELKLEGGREWDDGTVKGLGTNGLLSLTFYLQERKKK